MAQSLISRRRISSVIEYLLYIICIVPVFSLGCGLFEPAKDDVVIVVGSRHVTTDELKREMEFTGDGIGISDWQEVEIRDKLLEQIIDRYLIIEYAREKGIAISEMELKTALEDIKTGYTEKTFQDALLRGCVDSDEWKDRLRVQLLFGKVMKIVTEGIVPPSYQEIKSYYEAHKDEFRVPRMLSFRQIVTSTKKQADDLLLRLQNGEKMGELAKKYSIGPEAKNGGKVDWVGRGYLEESMEKALFSMQKGKISKVIKSPYGYHIFEVLSIRSKGMKRLSEVIKEVESRLLSQRRKAFCEEWLRKQRTHFNVKVDRAILNKLELS
ncbi:MAG TPA: hypothetical protein DDW42_09390 [Desulfobacteraceae bacterium]|nr:hypothetical protein [Desulfobacteraceae bacterium]